MSAAWTKSGRTSVLLMSVMIAASGLAWALTPSQPSLVDRRPGFADLIPRSFGEWREVETVSDAIDPRMERDTEPSVDSPYDEILMRSYANEKGDVVLLALAYGRAQRQEIKVHRPELCYVAQGFAVVERSPIRLQLERAAILGSRMLVEAPGRVELVSYWVRIGDLYSDNAWGSRFYLFIEGLKGRILDGILVRVSQTVVNRDAASEDVYRFQERFLADLLRAAPADARRFLVGSDAAADL